VPHSIFILVLVIVTPVHTTQVVTTTGNFTSMTLKTEGLFRLFRPTGYLLPFGTTGRHTQAWASPPPQPVASWPHQHHCWLSASRRSAGRYLERFWSVSGAFLERSFERFLAVLGSVSNDFSAEALHSAHLSPPFAAPMALVR
jgi:hypothetical protein